MKHELCNKPVYWLHAPSSIDLKAVGQFLLATCKTHTLLQSAAANPFLFVPLLINCVADGALSAPTYVVVLNGGPTSCWIHSI